MKSSRDFFGGMVVGAMLTTLGIAVVTTLEQLDPQPMEFQPLAIRSASQPAIARVIDGDTVCVNVQLIDDVWLYNSPMRLQGIDCPEMNTPEGVAAKVFAEKWIGGYRCQAELSGKRDKYGRLLGDIVGSDQVRLTDSLLANGHAKRVSY